jgi:DNA-binding transcriptional LysR family regulator
MDIIKLKSFMTIANLLSFSEASEQLYVSQSSLSKQIISLEKEFGYQLFDRSKKRISLTKAGNLTLNHTQTIVMEYETLLQELENLNHDYSNMVKISSIPVMAHYGFTSLIGNFAKINPTIIINVQELEGNQIIPSLESMEYDFAFMRSDSIDPLKFEFIPLYEDHLVAVLPLNHPLAKKELISISQLAQDFFLFFDPVTLIYDISYNACIHSGFKPKVIHTGTRVENIAELISSGMGVSLIMQRVVTYLNNPFLSIVPLKEVLTSQLSLVRIRDRKMNESSTLFWNQIKKGDFGGLTPQL